MMAPVGVAAVTQALEWLGANQWMIILVSGLFALYHFRSALLVASQVATALKVVGVLVVLALVASAGLVPGFDIIVEVETLAGWLGEQAQTLWDLVGDVI